jgi:hypothetical protein
MAQNKSGHRPAGGISSNKVVHRPHGKTEPRAMAKNPGGVGQFGNLQGAHATNKGDTGYRGDPVRGGRGYEPPGMISDPVKAVGVGGGRTIYKSGSQEQYGSGGTEKPAGRDILSDFGPDYRK